jgi:hypothetical protein
MNLNLKFLITGCPCSGTTYVAALLRDLRFDARHEVLSYTDEKGWYSVYGHNPEVEVSYRMSHWTDKLPANTPTVILLRHPVKVFNSYLSAMDNRRNLKKPDALEPVSIPSVIKLLYLCNHLASLYRGLVGVHKIEDGDMRLIELVGKHCARNVPDPVLTPNLSRKDVNHHNKGKFNFTADDIRGMPMGFEFLQFYTNAGYQV